MANLTIDKIKYGDNAYILQDSKAPHISADGNLKINGTLAADIGVFNQLIATNATIDNLDVDNLSAYNATVVGLLDVKGNLHTNSWTNSNIATIQGNFYIAPTVMTGTSSGDTGVTITAISNGSAVNGYWTLVLSGTNILTFPNLEADKATSTESESSYNAWSSGSLVMITGSIKKDGITFPLGTLKGELSGTISSNRVTITKITDNLNANPSTLQEYGAGTYGFVEIKISLYQRAYNNNLYPLGILMSAQGRASKSFIDIYGGGNIYTNGNLDPESSTTHTSDYGGLAIPNVRIGNLRGLPNILTGDFEDNAGLPTGWGIYTDNGFFKGTLVSTQGRLGLIDNYINVSDGGIDIVGATITGTNVNLTIEELAEIVDPEAWEENYREYQLTEDTTVVIGKTYYELIEDYEKTTDTVIFEDKAYYTRSGSGTTQNPYEYTIVETPNVDNLNTYYEYITYKQSSLSSGNPKTNGLYEAIDMTIPRYISSHFEFTAKGLEIQGNSNDYSILLASDGMHVYKEDNPVASFGENIMFSSEVTQRIGGENAYIEFIPKDPANNESTEQINIIASNILIGSQDIVETIESKATTLDNKINSQTKIVEEQQTVIQQHTQTLQTTSAYVKISPDEGYIAVGKTSSDSQSRVFISGAPESKVAIQHKKNDSFMDVAYMKGERFYAPSMVTTNLYMKAKDTNGELTGSIGWVMRTNNHLSLKLIS